MNALMAITLVASLASVQESRPEFKGTGWVNSKDLSLDRLHGKIVVLYFFEIN
jgi:hypothetical protein